MIGIRLRARLLGFRWRRRRQLAKLLRDADTLEEQCPACDATNSAILEFKREGETVRKHFCRGCEHMWSDFMQTDVSHGQVVFETGRENSGKATQSALLMEVAELSGRLNGTFLDFGVGGNIGSFKEAAQQLPQHRFMGCDVYPSTVPGYFSTYDADAPVGQFDGISSYAVIEHLTNTLDAWLHLNRLLKPMADGGGLMIHSFPSQWHLGFDDWAIQISGHSCVFSRESLKRVCRRSGFEILKADPPRFIGPHYHPVFVFRKICDV
jgi:hypothetical protein